MHQLKKMDQIVQGLRRDPAIHVEAATILYKIASETIERSGLEVGIGTTPRIPLNASPLEPPTPRIPIADADTLAVRWNGKTCFLGKTLAFKLFERLARRPNHFLSHDLLLDEVWECRVTGSVCSARRIPAWKCTATTGWTFSANCSPERTPMEIPDILLMKDRRYLMILMEKIKVINPRIRNEEQFQLNVQSIDNNGMLMPIRVNDKFLEKTGLYELICGEGRLIAHQRLGKTEIMAEVVTCTRKEAYLQSLIENLARSNPGTMIFARELKQLHDENWDYAQIGKLCCRTPEYVRQYVGLVEKGENRLIQGVEQGVFPISFAILVAQSDDSNIQNVLMDAFDQGIVNCQNFARARRIVGDRLERASQANGNGKKDRGSVTVSMLKKDISDLTKAKDSFVREAASKENRFLTLLTAINTLWHDEAFVAVVKEEQINNRPELVGQIGYET